MADVICEREALRRELSLQMSMKAETEMAMKLLEKDVKEKRDTIVELRDQLEDVKKVNFDMYMKLQVRLDNRGKSLFSFKRQFFLEFVKGVPLPLTSFRSWQECEADITQKGQLVAKLESKTKDISKMLEKLNHTKTTTN